MSRRRWVRLDNASNIFLAARTATDTKVFRLTAQFEEPVKPDVLQKALDIVYAQYPLYHSVLRRGIFWYYLEESGLKPKVMLETRNPCTQIYHYDKQELLFRVMYRHERVHMEVFHALSDGTGALWFFQDLITEYLHLQEVAEISRSARANQAGARTSEEQLENSFFRYFKRSGQKNFEEAAESALAHMPTAAENEEEVPDYSLKAFGKSVYRIQGTRTPDDRMNVVEMDMSVKSVLELAHQYNASLTVYLCALFMEAVLKAAPLNSPKEKKIRLSLPVNLRQFFPSKSARNFFTAIYLSYTFQEQKEFDFQSVCDSLQSQLKSNLKKEQLQKRLNKLISFEYHPLIRGVIRPVKDLALKGINFLNNRQITLALSNLGRVSIPEPLAEKVKLLAFQTSAVRPQCSVVSFNDRLTISFTSPFTETRFQKEFVRSLTEKGVEVTVAANKVAYEEIEKVF